MTLDQRPDPQTGKGLARMGLAALGVVFGDIGTSPLYTLKTVLDMTGGVDAGSACSASLSLLIWTLIIVTSVKYVVIRHARRQ